MQIKYEQIPKQQDSSFCSYLRESDEYPFEMHYHSQYELVYIVQGCGKTYAKNTAIGYDKGDLFVFGPNMPHTFVSKAGHNQAIVIQFSRDILGEQIGQNKDLGAINELLCCSDRGLVFREGLTNDIIHKLLLIPDQAGFERLMSLLSVINSLCLLTCVRLFHSTAGLELPKQSRSLLKILNYVHRNFEEEITLKTASRLIGMSESGFAKFFKRNMDCSFNDYLIDLRIDLACDLLGTTDDKIIDICYKAGFNNLSNFNRQFKKRKKVTPRQYRILYAKK